MFIFHNRDVFYAHVVENIGFEQCRKGEDFVRPILVYKKFNNHLFLGIPLSTTPNRSKYYFNLTLKKIKKV